MTPQPLGSDSPEGSTDGVTRRTDAGTERREESPRSDNGGHIPAPPGPPPARSAASTTNDTGGGSDNPTEVSSKGPDGPDAHGIFDERLGLFADPFGSTCEREGVKTAVLIVADPKIPRQPIVFLRGNKYDAAKLVAALLRQLQQQILNDISAH